MRNKKGFTLIELLLVVAILAFLIAIIVIAASNISEDSKKKSMYASLKSVKTALETYYLTYSEFPKTGIDETTGLYALVEIAEPSQRLLDNVPDDMFDPGEPVGYELDALATPGRTYAAWSVGPGGTGVVKVNGQDDIDTTTGNPIYVTNCKGEIWKP